MAQLQPPSPDVHLLRQALDASGVGTVITDALHDDHPIIYVNAVFEQLTGYRAADTLGHDSRFLLGQDRDQPGVTTLRHALQHAQRATVTLCTSRKDGTLFHNEITLIPLSTVPGIVTHFVWYQRDVSAHEEAALNEHRGHQQFLATLEHLPDGFASFDRQLKVTYINTTAATLFEQSINDLLGHNLLTTFPALEGTAIMQAIQCALASGTSQQVTWQLLPSGKWVHATVYPVQDGLSLVTRDITPQHHAQESLRISEERFSTVFQANPLPMVITRLRDQRYLEVNEAFVHASGYARSDVIGRTSLELEIWADVNERDHIKRALEDNGFVRRREVRLRHTTGEIRDAAVSIVLVQLDGEPSAVTLAVDITSEKRAQRTLEDSERRARQLAAELQRTLDLSLDVITAIDADGCFVTVSAASQQLLGYTPEELLGHSYLEFVHPDDQVRTVAAAADIPLGRTRLPFQNRYFHKSGAVVWLEWDALRVSGDPSTYCVVRDITQRRVAEEAQAYLAAIVHTSQDAILGVTPDGLIQSWNEGAEQLYGYHTEDIIGQPVTVLAPRALQAEQAQVLERARRGEQVHPFETVRVTRDGRHIPVLVTASAIRDASGQVLGISKMEQNITHRKAAETEIQQLNAHLQQQLNYLTGLRKIDLAIASSQALPITLGMILENLQQQLGADAITVLLLNPHTLQLECAGVRGFTTRPHAHAVRLDTSLAGEVVRRRRALPVPDLHLVALTSSWKDLLKREGLETYFGAPLMAKGKVLGVIEVLHRSPFEPSASWVEMFDTLAAQAAIAVDNAQLFEELEHTNLELRLAYDETIEGWARALDLRDKETEGHSRRVTEMTVRLCQHLGVPSETLVEVRRGALLHDIGKMGIPDAVLLKPGALTEEEWGLMKKHPGYAVSLLSPIRFLRPALDIPQYHHEKWDGSGYPLGLRGEAIPLPARAFAVVDVYDALTSDRPYRAAWTSAHALEHIQGGAGTHFDPAVVQAFLRMLNG